MMAGLAGKTPIGAEGGGERSLGPSRIDTGFSKLEGGVIKQLTGRIWTSGGEGNSGIMKERNSRIGNVSWVGFGGLKAFGLTIRSRKLMSFMSLKLFFS